METMKYVYVYRKVYITRSYPKKISTLVPWDVPTNRKNLLEQLFKNILFFSGNIVISYKR